VSQAQLENTLKDLARQGKLVEKDDRRQVWRFEHEGKPYHLHFYPRALSAIGRMLRGNPALREFQRLQWLQKAGIASPRASSLLIGFRLDDQIGDAVILESIEPSVRLDDYIFDQHGRGKEIPRRRLLRDQLFQIISDMAKARLRHGELELRRFIVTSDRIYLSDARGVERGGVTLSDLLRLAHSAGPVLTRSDVLFGWQDLGPAEPAPEVNRMSRRLWRRFARTVRHDNEHFGTLSISDWSGVFTRRAPRPVAWSAASRTTFSREDWLAAWTLLLERIGNDQLTIVKRDASGDVLSGDVVLDGRPVSVIVKRPKRKSWWRYAMDLPRRSRARRTWIKTWKMLIRDIPCEWPLLMMEKRVLGYTIDSVIVFERTPGATLAAVDLDVLSPRQRDELFHRTGHVLRRIDDLGFMHADAKSTNWIVFDDPARGPTPVLIDLDGVRHYRWPMMGIERLLRAMKQHKQYTPHDSLMLCRGYAPEAKLVQESPSEQPSAT
jgi:tRNA A-37 threonylcarbamoyl transferase component Bud32